MPFKNDSKTSTRAVCQRTHLLSELCLTCFTMSKIDNHLLGSTNERRKNGKNVILLIENVAEQHRGTYDGVYEKNCDGELLCCSCCCYVAVKGCFYATSFEMRYTFLGSSPGGADALLNRGQISVRPYVPPPRSPRLRVFGGPWA